MTEWLLRTRSLACAEDVAEALPRRLVESIGLPKPGLKQLGG